MHSSFVHLEAERDGTVAAPDPERPPFDFGFHIDDPGANTGQPPMPLHMREVKVWKRPGLERFLQRASQLGEVILWTASLPVYAYPIAEIFDASHHTRGTLTRVHTWRTQKGFVKDLSRLGRPLSRTILVDNSPVAFTLQPDNAVPITSFYGDPRDTALEALGDFLESLDPLQDVRPFLRQRFQMLSKLLHAGMLLGAAPYPPAPPPAAPLLAPPGSPQRKTSAAQVLSVVTRTRQEDEEKAHQQQHHPQ